MGNIYERYWTFDPQRFFKYAINSSMDAAPLLKKLIIQPIAIMGHARRFR